MIGLVLLACAGNSHRTVYRVEGEVVEMRDHTDKKMHSRGIAGPTHTRLDLREVEVWEGSRQLPDHEWQRILKRCCEREDTWSFLYDGTSLSMPPAGGRAEFRANRYGIGWRYRVVGERRGCQW